MIVILREKAEVGAGRSYRSRSRESHARDRHRFPSRSHTSVSSSDLHASGAASSLLHCDRLAKTYNQGDGKAYDSLASDSNDFNKMLRDHVKYLTAFNGSNLKKVELDTWLTKWDVLFERAHSSRQTRDVFDKLVMKLEGTPCEIARHIIETKGSWKELRKTLEEDFSSIGGYQGACFEWHNLRQGTASMVEHQAKVMLLCRKMNWDLETRDLDKLYKYTWSLSSEWIQNKLNSRVEKSTLMDLLTLSRELDLQTKRKGLSSTPSTTSNSDSSPTVMVSRYNDHPSGNNSSFRQ